MEVKKYNTFTKITRSNPSTRPKSNIRCKTMSKPTLTPSRKKLDIIYAKGFCNSL